MPDHRTWARALLRGFKPNGSSWSPDRIYGVKIGTKNSSFAYSRLPANLHDYRYQVAGPWTRLRADVEFYAGLLEAVSHLPHPFRAMAQVRCLTYFAAVRLLGWIAWRGEKISIAGVDTRP